MTNPIQDTPSSEPLRPTNPLAEHIEHNIESIVAIQRREWEMTTPSQRRLELMGRFIGRPVFLLGLLALVALWIVANLAARSLGFNPVDPPPFEMLEGMLTLIALLTTIIVLITQNRQTKLEQQHTHLALQVNLLTEQKVTKLILLIEELRRDMPMVRDRDDPQAAAMQRPADTSEVLTAMEDVGLTKDAKLGL